MWKFREAGNNEGNHLMRATARKGTKGVACEQIPTTRTLKLPVPSQLTASGPSYLSGVSCRCVGTVWRARPMNIAYRYLRRVDCPRECLQAALISRQMEFDIRYARLNFPTDRPPVPYKGFAVWRWRARKKHAGDEVLGVKLSTRSSGGER